MKQHRLKVHDSIVIQTDSGPVTIRLDEVQGKAQKATIGIEFPPGVSIRAVMDLTEPQESA